MPTLEECVSQIFKNCGGPAPEVLSLDDASDFYLSALDHYLQKLAGSEGFHLGGQPVPWTPQLRVEPLGGDSPTTIPNLVEYQVNQATDEWDMVSIVNVGNIDTFENLGRYAIAFYGQPVWYRLSWDPTTVQVTLRRWYSPDVEQLGGLTATPPLPRTFFQNMVPMRATVIDAFPQLILRDAGRYQGFVNLKMETYAQQLREWESQFDSFVYENKEQGQVQIEPFDAADRGGMNFSMLG